MIIGFAIFATNVLIGSVTPAFAIVTNITATDAETDNNNGFTRLNTPDYVTTFTVSGIPYAIVSTTSGEGIQIINLSNPTDITAADAETDDNNGFTVLDNTNGAATFTVSDTLYAIVTDGDDDGVQIINLSDPTNITAADAETDNNNGFTVLDNARDVATFTVSDIPYAIVTASGADDGVQIINLSDPTNITASDAETDNNNGFTRLDTPDGVATFTVSGTPYAIVTASGADNGVQIINLSDPTNITAADAETDNNNGFTVLGGAFGVATFTVSDIPYAIVTSNGADRGVQIINLSDPTDITAADAETDDNNGFTVLDNARGVATFESDRPYAIVTAVLDNGVQIIDLSDPTNITASDAETDNNNEFTVLDSARDVAIFTVVNVLYAIVAANGESGVQIIKLGSVTADPVTPVSAGGDNKWYTKPTFGLSHYTGKSMVQCGFSWNETCYDITKNWHTPFENVDVDIGTQHNMTVKASFHYDPRYMEFALVPDVGEYGIAETRIKASFENAHSDDISIKSISVIQKDNLIDESLLSGAIAIVDCGYVSKDCYELSINGIMFREIPSFEKIAIKAVDFKGRVQVSFLNEGFEFDGISLNEPPTHKLFNKESSQQKDNLWLELTRTDKVENLWTDQFGTVYTFNDYGTWSKVTPEPTKPEVDIGKEQIPENIPEWVRTIFIWYAEEQISEDELLNGIQFLIEKGIMQVD